MAKAKSNDERFDYPSLSRVLGYIAVKELRRPEDRVRILAQLGYSDIEIVKICGVTVRKAISARAKGK